MNLFNRKDYYIRGIQYNGIPIGAVGIKKIFNDSGEYWGYIGEKEYWGKGIGKLMLMQMVKDARTIFSLKNLYLKVLHVNERAIGLYKSLGFTIVSDDGSFYIMSLTL
jgi:RimJ/RimL family protein N-acetyltransferase